MDETRDDGSRSEATPDGARRRRPPPTLDLSATGVTRPAPDESADPPADAVPPDMSAPADPSPEPVAESVEARETAAPPPPSERRRRGLLTGILSGALAGAAAAALLLGTLWALHPPEDRAAAGKIEQARIALESRVAALEKRPIPVPAPPAAAPAIADPAPRLAALDKAVADLRTALAAAQGQAADALAAAQAAGSAAPSAPAAAPAAPAFDPAPLEAALGQIDTAVKAQSAVIADAIRQTAAVQGAVAALAKARPDDSVVRRAVVALSLDTAIRQGEAYAATLAAAKPLAANAAALAPLDPFAASGVPEPAALCGEVLTLLPQTPEPRPSGIVDRLTSSATRLVKIERVDAPEGADRSAVSARLAAAARRNDLAEARQAANALPAEARAPLQGWIGRVDARAAALAAARQFASESIAALAAAPR